MPRKEEQGTESIAKLKLTKKEKIAAYVLIALAVVSVILIIMVISLLVSNSRLKINLAALENEVSGQSDQNTISLSEDIAIIKANIFSCGTDPNCVSLFRDRKYTCPSGLVPKCDTKFCICG
jgi:hypothetical protein